MPTTPLKDLYKRLRDVGFTKQYVTKVAALPSWWNDDLAENPAGYAECLIHLSRHLGLDMKSLQDPSATLRLKDFGVCKYKKRQGTTEDELLVGRVIATRAAQLAAAAIEEPYQPIPTAADVRQALLEDAPWVDFDSLLEYCWARGVPVLHVNLFPTGTKRPDGFTLRVAGRPVIVLCRDERQPSWQLFILAHELGHIACGHIPENGSLLDEKVNDNEQDSEEEEADRYAIELLTGKATTCIGTNSRWPKMDELAAMAKKFGQRNSIDPGHVVLNYAHTMGPTFFAVARGALKLLYPDADAVAMIRDRLAANLDWGLLPEESSEFLMRMTRQESDE